jgi:hypothetical protein
MAHSLRGFTALSALLVQCQRSKTISNKASIHLFGTRPFNFALVAEPFLTLRQRLLV